MIITTVALRRYCRMFFGVSGCVLLTFLSGCSTVWNLSETSTSRYRGRAFEGSSAEGQSIIKARREAYKAVDQYVSENGIPEYVIVEDVDVWFFVQPSKNVSSKFNMNSFSKSYVEISKPIPSEIMSLLPDSKNKNGSPQFVHVETQGNLLATNPVECVDSSKITNKLSPADMMAGVPKCINSGDYPKAAKLYLYSMAYGHYDQLRVADKTAHQGLSVMAYKTTAALTKEQNEKARETYQEMMKNNLSENCSFLKKLGPPSYYPSYMIQHGVNAISGISEAPLVSGFESASAWNDTLQNWLHCPSHQQ